jgi:hypothetical protein
MLLLLLAVGGANGILVVIPISILVVVIGHT